jgi:polar amino acid transport system substrate-binding protein
MSRRTSAFLLVPLVASSLLIASCGSSDSSKSASNANAKCPTVASGKLTIGTDSPAYEPWFAKDDPSNGKGFESAVAYAVAKNLGYAKSDVVWKKVPFNNSYAPGKKAFDFDINQISISKDRKKAVDFSDGYYDVNQAIVGMADSKAAGAKTVADLKGLKLGAQVGTTSLDFINNVIKPTQKPYIYNDNNAAKAAFAAKQIDGIVLDLPTALYVSAAEIEGSKVIGQFPTTGDKPEQFGMVLQKGSKLTGCVNDALATMTSDGTLAKIQKTWLADAIAPEIKLG